MSSPEQQLSITASSFEFASQILTIMMYTFPYLDRAAVRAARILTGVLDDRLSVCQVNTIYCKLHTPTLGAGVTALQHSS